MYISILNKIFSFFKKYWFLPLIFLLLYIFRVKSVDTGINSALNNADLLHKALSSLNTNEDLIFSVLEGKSVDDLEQISQEYGTRSFISLFSGYVAGSGFLSKDYTLFQILNRKLNEDELNRLNDLTDGAYFEIN